MRKTLYKTMNGRKTGNTGRDNSDRKHLTGREVERCNDFRCSLTKNALPVGFMRARSLSHARTTRSKIVWHTCSEAARRAGIRKT